MTGAEFYNKVNGIRKITDVHWSVKGDCLDPDEVKVVVIADGEEISMTYPVPTLDREQDSTTRVQIAALALMLNKLMEQLENDFRACASNDLRDAVNYARNQITKG